MRMKLKEMVRGTGKRTVVSEISSDRQKKLIEQKINEEIERNKLPAVLKAEFDSGERELRTV